MKKFLLLTFASLGLSLSAQVGVNTNSPTTTLDVNGNLRVRQLDYTTSGSLLIANDATGVVGKTKLSEIKVPQIAAVWQRNNEFQYRPTNYSRFVLPLEKNIVKHENLLTYNSQNNMFTVHESGIYNIQFQVGFLNPKANADLLIGVLNSSGNWIGRATFSIATDGKRIFNAYSTTLVFNSGDVFAIGLSGENDVTFTVQGDQNGGTGMGNLTNVTITKY